MESVILECFIIIDNIEKNNGVYNSGMIHYNNGGVHMSEESKETKKENEAKENEEKERETEQIKTDAKTTFNNAKESIRNVNFKEDAKITSGYVSGMIKNPLETLKKIAADRKNSNFKNALILVFLWLIVILLTSIFGVHWTKKVIGYNFLEMVRTSTSNRNSCICIYYLLYAKKFKKKFNNKYYSCYNINYSNDFSRNFICFKII